MLKFTYIHHIQDSLYQAPPSSNPTSSAKSVIIDEGNENIEDDTSDTEVSNIKCY